jgi:hypothetical protein
MVLRDDDRDLTVRYDNDCHCEDLGEDMLMAAVRFTCPRDPSLGARVEPDLAVLVLK